MCKSRIRKCEENDQSIVRIQLLKFNSNYALSCIATFFVCCIALFRSLNNIEHCQRFIFKFSPLLIFKFINNGQRYVSESFFQIRQWTDALTPSRLQCQRRLFQIHIALRHHSPRKNWEYI
jgi:hypothetical protein